MNLNAHKPRLHLTDSTGHIVGLWNHDHVAGMFPDNVEDRAALGVGRVQVRKAKRAYDKVDSSARANRRDIGTIGRVESSRMGRVRWEESAEETAAVRGDRRTSLGVRWAHHGTRRELEEHERRVKIGL
ncbi:hypothetical protein BDN67DRAFT_969061 [Paxillus ammoniavirescens]|nr:hypothetical protein BDN67DRAFT_969061 [Paxillus ammoniavirescens]